MVRGNREYTLKPFQSPTRPNAAWAVTGPVGSRGLRWRRLFITRDDAEEFLRAQGLSVKEVSEAAMAGGLVVADEVPAKVRAKRARGRRRVSPRFSRLQIACGLLVLVALAFAVDRMLRAKMVRELNAAFLANDFESNPILTGWKPSNEGADWSVSEHASGARSIMVSSGSWSSPSVRTRPLQWYRIAFQSKAPGVLTNPGAIGYGYCSVSFHDVTGGQLLASHYASVLQSNDWQMNELRVRAEPVCTEDGTLKAGSMKIVFTPIGGQPFFLDDVKVERVSASEVGRWADEAYSRLPAQLSYQPKPSRWSRIPRALGTLKQGGVLRILMLGDSVQADTANAPLDVFLERSYPGSRVEIVTSTRSGTGMDFFKDHVHEYVSRYRPDLVIIGGISHSDGIPAYQQFVDQMRANDAKAGRKTEIMLTTRSWSPSPGPGHPDAFFLRPEMRELDQIRANNAVLPDDERGRLLRFADAYGIEYLDLTGIISEFIHGPAQVAGVGPPANAAGEPYKIWMRDWVHPNPAGREILGRVLEAYFAPERSGNLPNPVASRDFE